MCTNLNRKKQMKRDQPVNMYQLHQQRYHSYAMPQAPPKRSFSEEPIGKEALVRSLDHTFYVTSYQSHHSSKPTGWYLCMTCTYHGSHWVQIIGSGS